VTTTTAYVSLAPRLLRHGLSYTRAAMLQPSPDDLLTTRPVSRLVNDVKNDGPRLLLPAA